MSDDIRGNYGDDFFSPPLARAPEGRCQVCGWPLVDRCPGCVALEGELRHATAIVRDLENKMLPVNEYVAKLEEALTLKVIAPDLLVIVRRIISAWDNLDSGADGFYCEIGNAVADARLLLTRVEAGR